MTLTIREMPNSPQMRRRITKDKVINEYTRRIQVRSTQRLVGPATIRAAVESWLNTTDIYSFTSVSGGTVIVHELDALAAITDWQVQRESLGGNEDVWVVAINYSTDDDKKNCDEETIHPLLQPQKVSYISSRSIRAVEKARLITEDDDGNEVVGDEETPLTSAKGPFEPPLERDDTRFGVRITRSTTTFSLLTAKDFTDAVNSRPIVIRGVTFPERTAKVASWTAEEVIDGSCLVYFNEELVLEFRADDWDLTPLDADFEELVNGERQAIMKNGLKIDSPHPLDGAGAAADLGAAFSPVLRQYRVYPEEDFRPLTLPEKTAGRLLQNPPR